MRKSADRYRKSLIGITVAAVCAVSALGSEAVLGAAMTDGTYTVCEGCLRMRICPQRRRRYIRKRRIWRWMRLLRSPAALFDTNYTAMEYEQLRDMLTNNLIYSSPNAAISVSGTTQMPRIIFMCWWQMTPRRITGRFTTMW